MPIKMSLTAIICLNFKVRNIPKYKYCGKKLINISFSKLIFSIVLTDIFRVCTNINFRQYLTESVIKLW